MQKKAKAVTGRGAGNRENTPRKGVGLAEEKAVKKLSAEQFFALSHSDQDRAKREGKF
jgi:hypothetical protein